MNNVTDIYNRPQMLLLWNTYIHSTIVTKEKDWYWSLWDYPHTY